MFSSGADEVGREEATQEIREQRIVNRFDYLSAQDGPQKRAVVLHFLGFGAITLVGIDPEEARVEDIAVELNVYRMTSPQGMDELFWGRDHEDVNDWVERLTMVAEVRDLNANKLFKIAKLNLRANFLEVLLNDEEATLQQLNKLCGSENVFSYTRVPRRRMPVEVAPAGAVTQAFCRIDEVPIKVGGVQCTMTFMIVDTDSYDVLIGLDLLIKIGAIIDVEQGLIQVRHGPGSDVEVLPLTMVNMLQKMNSATLTRDDATLEDTHGDLDVIVRQPSLYEYVTTGRLDALVSDSDSDTNEDREGRLQLVEPVDDESEFGNTELEDLVSLEGPQQILQLTLQKQADDLMKEEITDVDDYVNWIRWVADAEQGK
ncbi:unnamed protein product [Sphagnum jensenii]